MTPPARHRTGSTEARRIVVGFAEQEQRRREARVRERQEQEAVRLRKQIRRSGGCGS